MAKASIVRRPGMLSAALACAGLLGAAATLAAGEAGTLQPLGSLRAAAEAAVRSQLRGVAYPVQVQAAEPDARLRLAQCPAPLMAAAAGNGELSAHVTVRVSCAVLQAQWSVYVPVALEADIPVLVLRQSQIRGARLGPQEVVLETRHVAGLGTAYLGDVAALAHRTLLRTVPAGTALSADLFQTDFLIRQGQAVTLVASGPGVEVRAPAKALEDAREGSHLRVQNLASLKIVQGVVDASGLVYASP